MCDKHSGLQNKIKNISCRECFVSYASHTLNLVINDAAKLTIETGLFLTLSKNCVHFSLHPLIIGNMTRLTLTVIQDGE